jgi:ribosome maturation factor RimP
MTARMQEQEKLFAEIEALLAAAGLDLLELTLSRRGKETHVKAVIHVSSGTGTEQCVAAHRLMFPRLQILLGEQEPFIEVASPGIDRILKSRREWEIFKGKAVRVLDREGGEWIFGKIVSVEGDRVTLANAGSEFDIDLGRIAKARLDSSREGD